MTAFLKINRQAAADLESIWHYIARENVKAAEKVGRRIAEKFQMICHQPEIGDPQFELQPGLRSVLAGKYVLRA